MFGFVLLPFCLFVGWDLIVPGLLRVGCFNCCDFCLFLLLSWFYACLCCAYLTCVMFCLRLGCVYLFCLVRWLWVVLVSVLVLVVFSLFGFWVIGYFGLHSVWFVVCFCFVGWSVF